MVSFHLRIHGHVQGVSFRYYAEQRAAALGLTGWIRNCPDGTVEAVIQGDSDTVDQFVAWAEHGPPGAHVERVDAEPADIDPVARSFRVVG